MTVFHTIGHSTRTLGEFAELLHGHGVKLVCDVRSIPRSRANRQYEIATLPGALAGFGLDYVHLAALGGRRWHRKGAPPSPNGLWRVAAFRHYADYALTEDFAAGLAELERLGAAQPAAFMCAEAVWWRCHRRIVADYLLVRGHAPRHIMGPGRADPATLTPGAVPQPDGTILYPPAPEPEPEPEEREDR